MCATATCSFAATLGLAGLGLWRCAVGGESITDCTAAATAAVAAALVDLGLRPWAFSCKMHSTSVMYVMGTEAGIEQTGQQQLQGAGL